jgi:dipeptidyl aminopeptidase/acylaminoacyl peptidase
LGWSYGGYAALAGAAFTPDVYQCAVSINGVSDLTLMIEREKRKYGSEHWVYAYWKNLVSGNKKDVEALLETASPIHHVKNIKAPILLIHGSKDRVVNIEQSENMLEELEALNKSVAFKRFDGENHNLSDSNVRAEVLGAVIGFVGKHIGNKK